MPDPQGMWTDEERSRPMSVIEAERERTASRAAASGNPPSGSQQPAEAPAPSACALLDCDCHECRAARAVASGLSYGVAAPAPILRPDEYDLMRRMEKLESHLLNVEAMLALAIQVATTAADIAKGRTQ